MFISNDCPSFCLWLKENLVKHQKVSNYYETDCILDEEQFSVQSLSTISSKQNQRSACLKLRIGITCYSPGN